MNRREFLKSVGAIPAGITAMPHSIAASQNSTDKTQLVTTNTLDKHGWKSNESLPKPALPDHTELLKKTQWETQVYTDTTTRDSINEQINEEVTVDLKLCWVTRITTDNFLKQKYWNALGRGEAAEIAYDADDATQDAFEKYVDETANGGKFEYVTEGHRKATSFLVTNIPGMVPGVGEVIPIGIDMLWDLQTTINTATGGDSYLSQYFYDYPISTTALGLPASYSLDDTGSLNYRALYADWMAADAFFAGGVVYPETAEHLADRLGDAFATEIELTPDRTYEEEALDLLTHISKTPE